MENFIFKKHTNSYSFTDQNGKTISKLKFYDYKLKNFDWVLIADVETDPEYRGQGLASKLLNTIYSDITSRYPNKGLYLFVRPDNHTAIKLYKKLGFMKVKDYKLESGKFIIMCKGDADKRQFDKMKFA